MQYGLVHKIIRVWEGGGGGGGNFNPVLTVPHNFTFCSDVVTFVSIDLNTNFGKNVHTQNAHY